jgi:hypothetical protein
MTKRSPCRWFSVAELACRGSGMLRLHPGFAEALDAFRDAFGAPMVPSSVCRSSAHNEAVGGAAQSLHICDREARPGQQGTLAADIRTTDDGHAYGLMQVAASLGWSVGIPRPGVRFIHIDARHLIGLRPVVFGY